MPYALQAGIDPERFWDLSYADVCAQLEAYNAKNKMLQQQRAIMDYALARLIAGGFHAPSKMPNTVQHAYPQLFPKEPVKAGSWQEIKANMSAIAEIKNRKQRKEGANHDNR